MKLIHKLYENWWINLDTKPAYPQDAYYLGFKEALAMAASLVANSPQNSRYKELPFQPAINLIVKDLLVLGDEEV